MIDVDLALERVLAHGDEWQSWRALRLTGEAPGDAPDIPYQDELGGSLGPSDRPSPGATGEMLCHLRVLGLAEGPHAAIAADWLLGARTPALAWLDSPDDVPGELDTPGGARVWATASASAGLLAVGRDPGARAIDLLRGEADNEGRFTGGAYPTFAGAAAYWLAAGPKTEMSEWALRWLRDNTEDWWGPWEFATGLTFFAAAGIPLENATVDAFVERATEAAPPEGWVDDPGLTLRVLEVMAALGA
jgi:hypothetical protein